MEESHTLTMSLLCLLAAPPQPQVEFPPARAHEALELRALGRAHQRKVREPQLRDAGQRGEKARALQGERDVRARDVEDAQARESVLGGEAAEEGVVQE